METPGPSSTKLFRGTKLVKCNKKTQRCELRATNSRCERFCETGPRAYSWVDDLQAYVLFNSISVMSEGKSGDYEKLCVLKLHLRLEGLPSPAHNLLSYRGFRL